MPETFSRHDATRCGSRVPQVREGQGAAAAAAAARCPTAAAVPSVPSSSSESSLSTTLAAAQGRPLVPRRGTVYQIDSYGFAVVIV